ncbi:hypothetical protein R84981_002776 [Carnimonas sp. R-84981]|uniref:phage head morphogenesis protein n=1 Tax=Carnimonas bestiolae TaxID=3402172 RepID=UPI003EDBA6A0
MNKWRHPRAIESEYVRSLRKIARELRHQVNEQLIPEISRIHDMAKGRDDAVEEGDQDDTSWSGILAAILLAILGSVKRSPSYIVVIGIPAASNEAMGGNTTPKSVESILGNTPSNGRAGDSIAEYADRVNVFNLRQMKRAIKAEYGNDEEYAQRESLAGLLKAWERENLSLIRSIPDDYVTRLQGSITRAVNQGMDVRELRDLIKSTYDQPDHRAQLIAEDQIGKLNANLTRYRQQKAGVREYKWRGVLDNRERYVHKEREGRTFKWKEPPYDGHPGQPIRCRCWAEPVWPDRDNVKLN